MAAVENTTNADLSKIKKQLEYYFSNANFSKDKFLYETCSQNDGKIGIDVLLTFNRLKALEATPETIKEALKESTVVKVDGDDLVKQDLEDLKKYQEEKNVNERTVAITGFITSMTLEDVENFLKEHCNPLRILMRRRKNKVFSGTCFVELATVEEAKELLEKKMSVTVETETSNLSVTTKEEHIKAAIQNKEEDDVERIRKDFMPKLYKLITDKEILTTFKKEEKEGAVTMGDLKEKITNVAFIDTKKMIIRMKFVEEWDEKDFEDFKLKKLSPEEAREYVDAINIKVHDTNKKRKVRKVRKVRKDKRVKKEETNDDEE